MPRRSPVRLLAIATVLALLLAACGDPDAAVEQDPGDSLLEAFEALGDYEGFDLRIGLEIDQAILDDAIADAELTETEAAILAESTLVVRMHGEGMDASVEYVLTAGGVDVVEVRNIGDFDLYGRVDLAGLLELADEPDVPGTIDEVVGAVEEAGFRELAAALEDGDWIHVTGLAQMMSMYEGMVRGATGMGFDELEELGEELAEEVRDAFAAFLDRVDVAFVAHEDPGARVRITADGDALSSLATDVVEAFVEAVIDMGLFDDWLGGMAEEELREETDELLAEIERGIGSDFTLEVDAWISNGELTQVALDAGQFPDGPEEGELAIVLALAERDSPIEAPDDAVEIDLFRMMGGMMGMGFDSDPWDEDPWDELEEFDEDANAAGAPAS